MGWAAAGVAIASWLSSEEGRRASKAERERMQEMLDNIKDPNFDTTDIDFPTFQVLQRYVPQVSKYVEEADPRFVELSAEAKQGRSAQMEALRRLEEAGSSEGDIMSDAAINKARREAATTNRGMQGQIVENFNRRGMGGSGLEAAAALSAQQGGAERAGLESELAAVEGYKNRLNALMQSGELGGRLKNEETDLAGRNTSILNDWNQRKASNANSFNRYADSVHNDAQRQNIGEAQRIYEKNTGGTYDAEVNNRDRYNKLEQDRFDNDMSKVTGQQRQSAATQQGITNDTRDRNNAITGVGTGAQSYYQYEDDKDQREKDRQFKAQENEKDRQANYKRASDKY